MGAPALGRIEMSYRRSKFFSWLGPQMQGLYRQAADMSRLTEVNELFLRYLANLMELPTRLGRSKEVPRFGVTRTERLIEICLARDASTDVTGPAARAYIDASQFADAGIELRYANYSGYPEYDQNTNAFDHHTSVVDTLFNCGPNTRMHLKSLRDVSSFLDFAR